MKTISVLRTPWLIGGLLLAWLGHDAVVTAKDYREEIHQDYPLAENGRISLENINGSVQITAWDRNEVKVDAIKTARSQERFDETKIEIKAESDSIRIKTKQSRPQSFWFWGLSWSPAQVSYILRVPRHARIDHASTVNGSVSLEGVANVAKASTVNGSVKAKGVSGKINLSSVNGSVKATVDQVTRDQPISLSTVNGSASLILPAQANADISASTVNGGIHSDFALPVHKGFPLSRHLQGTLGQGGATLRLSTVNGGISIQRGPDTPLAKTTPEAETP